MHVSTYSVLLGIDLGHMYVAILGNCMYKKVKNNSLGW